MSKNGQILKDLEREKGWSKIIDFSPRWKWYKLKVLDEYRTAPISVSLDHAPFWTKNFEMSKQSDILTKYEIYLNIKI